MDNTILFIMLVAIALFMIAAYVLINVRLAELGSVKIFYHSVLLQETRHPTAG